VSCLVGWLSTSDGGCGSGLEASSGGSTYVYLSRRRACSLLDPITSSTIRLRSTELCALVGSTSLLSSPGGGQTPSWNMEPVSEPRARRSWGAGAEFWVLCEYWDAMEAFRERVLIFPPLKGKWNCAGVPLQESETALSRLCLDQVSAMSMSSPSNSRARARAVCCPCVSLSTYAKTFRRW